MFLVKAILVVKSGEQLGEFTLHKVVCHFCGLLLTILFIRETAELQLFKCISSTAAFDDVDNLKRKLKLGLINEHSEENRNNYMARRFTAPVLVPEMEWFRWKKPLKIPPVDQIRQIQIASSFI